MERHSKVLELIFNKLNIDNIVYGEIQKNYNYHGKNLIIRVGDGKNFFKSLDKNMYGFKQHNECFIKNIHYGDRLWFLTSKKFGGKLIAVATFEKMYNRHNEELISFNTYSNEEMGWIGEEDWCVQIKFKDIYIIKHIDYNIIIPCAAIVLPYNTWKNKISIPDLNIEYKNIKKYCKIYTIKDI